MTRMHVPVRTRWNDLDAYGHVNNAAMLVLLEEARVQAFWGAEIVDSITEPTTLWLVARQEVEYLAPVPYQSQPLDVQVWIGRLGGASLEICYEVCSPLEAEPFVQYSRAASTIVLVDPGTQRPRKITDEERAAWSAWLDEPVAFTRRP
jgi:acyl-CoA thioester hydrolase